MAYKRNLKNLPTRLCLDFKTPEALAQAFNDLKEAGWIAEDAGCFQMDGLDVLRNSGIPQSRTYVVRKIGERPESARLRVNVTSTETIEA